MASAASQAAQRAAAILLALLVLSSCQVGSVGNGPPPLSPPRATTSVSSPSPTATPTASPTPSPLPTMLPAPTEPLGLTRLWTWTARDILCALSTADVDGDARPEIAVASYDRSLYLIEASGSERWQVDTSGSVFALAGADLDGDGQIEFLVGSADGGLRAYAVDGSLLWEVPLGGRVTAVAAVDLDGDGRPEVLAGARPGRLAALQGDGTLLWQREVRGSPTGFLLLGGAENRTLLVSTEAGALAGFDPSGVSLWERSGAGYIRALASAEGLALAGGREGTLRWATSGGTVPREVPLGGPIPVVVPADLDADGRSELLVGIGGAHSGLAALNGEGRVLWRTALDRGVWALAFADLEGDGEAEVVAGTDGGQIAVLDRYGRMRGETWVPFRVHGLRAVDLNGDGRDEVLARASNHLYAFAGAAVGDPGEKQPEVATLPAWPADMPLIPPGDDQVVLVAVGDIMPGRSVEQRMLVYGPDFPFGALQPLLAQADIATGNLEGVLAFSGQPLRKSYTFRAHPGLVRGLQEAGFDLLSLANNHARDFGAAGLRETLQVLQEAGIAAVGAGPQAYDPVLLEVRGLRIAFLGRTAAIAAQPDVAWAQEEELRQAVARARERADLVVVHLHAGTEYSLTADTTQRRLARAAAEGGAALVIGHHPHAPQEVEWIGNTLVAYSLGDFVFDIDDHDIARDGLVLRAILSRRGVDAAETIPVRIVDDVQPRPRLASDGFAQLRPLFVRPEAPLPRPPFPRPAYRLRLMASPSTCTVRAVEEVRFPNTTGERLDRLVFQVFPRAFPGVFALGPVVQRGPAGEIALEPSLEGMMLELPLVWSAAPGDEVAVQLAFTLTLPVASQDAFFPEANLGCSEDELVLAFWYPMLTPVRSGQGWLTWEAPLVGDPLVLPIAEHTVDVQRPPGYQVIGAGTAQMRLGGTRLHLEAGRDLALVIGRGYVMEQRRVGHVVLQSYFRPEHRQAGRAALDTLAAALPLFEEAYGPFPYDTFRLVEAKMSCGLEHSTLALLGERFYGAYQGDPLDLVIRLAVHEFAHQWWYGVVGTDQVYEPWLDEGLAQFSEALYYSAFYPDLEPAWWERYGRPLWGPPSLRSTIQDYPSGASLLGGLYGQTASFFGDLRSQMGDERFFTALRAFYRRAAYRLARGQDLLFLLESSGGSEIARLIATYFW